MKSIFKLRKLFVYLALLLCAFSMGNNANAATGKFVGAYIYMDYAGKGSGDYLYRVNLVLYQKCSGGAYGFNATEQVCWSSQNCYLSLNWLSTALKPVDTVIEDGFCPSAGNSCTSTTSTNSGYVRVRYSDTIRLAGPCNDWVIKWKPKSGDTYPTLTNYTVPSWQAVGDVRITDFNNTKGAGYDYSTRGTPRWTAKPNFYFCLNSTSYFPTNPVDPKGANVSVVNNKSYYYQTISTGCNDARTDYSGYAAPGYSYAIPFGYTTGTSWTVNPTTGMCSVTPQTAGDFLVTLATTATDPSGSPVLCNIYNWTIINVSNNNCGPTIPDLDTIPQNVTGGTLDTTGGINKISICAGVKLDFSVEAKKSGANVHMAYNNKSIPASTVTILNDWSDDVTGTFSWTPTGNDVGDHIVTFEANDSTCSGGQIAISRKYIDVIIHVNYSVVATSPYNYCPPILPGDKASLPDTLHVSGPPGAIYTWTDTAGNPSLSCITCTDPTAAPQFDNTAYFVSSSVATGCKDADTVIVHIFPPDKFDAGPNHTICFNQSVQLAATVSPGDKYFWFPPDDLSDPNILNPLCKPKKNVDDTIYFHVTDVNKCNYVDTTIVLVNGLAPVLKVTAQPDSVCPDGSSQLNVYVLNPSNKPCGGTTTTPIGTLKYNGFDSARNDLFLSGPVGVPGDPNIFEAYYYGGQRQQIIYTANELYARGVSAGYITSVSFKFETANLVDTFYAFRMRMGCIADSQFKTTGTTFFPVSTTVFPPRNLSIPGPGKKGWYTFYFANAFYWDGVSNLVLDMCFSAPSYPSVLTNNTIWLAPTKLPQTAYTSQTYSGTTVSTAPGLSGCGLTGYTYYPLYTAQSRPATKFTEMADPTAFVYEWSPAANLDNTSISNPLATHIYNKKTYTVKVWNASDAAKKCVSQDSVHIAVDTSNHVVAIPENIVMCRPGYQQLSSKAYGPGPYSNLSCGTNSPVNCATTTTVSPGAKGNPGTDYSTSPFYYYSGKQQFIIRREELLALGMHSGTLRQMTIYPQPYPTYTYPGNVVNFELRVGCTPKKQFENLADTIPSAQLTQVYTAPSYTLTSSPWVMPFTTPYNWDTTQNLVFQICHGYGNIYLWYVATTNTSFSSAVTWYTYTSQSICGGSTASVYSSGAPTRKRPYVDLDYCPAPSLGANAFSYTWKPGTYLSDSSIQSPIAYVNNPGKVTTYSVYTRGRNGCLVHDSVNIYQPQHHYAIYPLDTIFCEGGTAKLNVRGASKTTTYQWFENGFQTPTTLSCNTCANPTAMPHNYGHTNIDTFTYQLVVSDSVGCNDTVFSRLEVKPIPVVRALTHDTTINYNGSVQLFATGAAVYTWTPTGSLNNPNIVNPIASPKEPTTYIVRGLSANGCAATDTVHVDINYHGHVFVPTAFTPNGDGKNDVFKVGNLTFEKVLEFHVFNRWGQELYYSTDNKGWDGYWHNAPQDIGTYQFLIRVASPDGTIETFKGDVTLLR